MDVGHYCKYDLKLSVQVIIIGQNPSVPKSNQLRICYNLSVFFINWKYTFL